MSDSTPHLLRRLAHDLRDPLSPLQTAVYLLRTGEIDAERQRELLDIIDRQTTRLGAMVEEVADWQRVEQDRLIDHREVSNLPMLVELACGKMQARGRTVVANLPASLDDVGIDGDAQRLVQMLGTLIAYMQSQAADTGVEIRGEPPTEGRVTITIARHAGSGTRPQGAADTLPEQAAMLFSAPQPTPFDDGLGWRLLIADAVARAHGGSLSARVVADAGLEVRLQLPVAAERGATRPRPLPDPSPGG